MKVASRCKKELAKQIKERQNYTAYCKYGYEYVSLNNRIDLTN